MSLPSSVTSVPASATVPSFESVFGSITTFPASGTLSLVKTTSWFCRPVFLEKK
jgi:hypothetical protein